MQHFHIIESNLNPLLQNPCRENSTRHTSRQVDEAPRTKQQIPDNVFLVDFVKRRKITKK